MTSQLSNYLKYYCELRNPGFAVLVVGPWGCGKTYQVKQALPFLEYHYVSLYGISDLGELMNTTLAVSNPLKSGFKNIMRATKGASVLGVGPGEFLSTSASHIKEDVDPKKIYVFDDLERCNLPLQMTLGFINRYIEHHECRVVVIADEEKLPQTPSPTNGESFMTAKEKLFGQTVVVEADTSSAFAAFIELIPNEHAKAFLRRHTEEFVDYFNRVGGKSLRVLRAALADVARLYGILDDELREAAFLQKNTLPMIFGLKIAALHGKLSKDDIINWRQKSYSAAAAKINATRGVGDDARPVVMEELQSLLKLSFDKCGLSEPEVAAMIFDGHFNNTDILESLQQRLSSLKGRERRPWQIAINFDEEDDQLVERAIGQMKKELAEFTTMPQGELLHHFSLLLLFARHKIIPENVAEIETLCKNYVKSQAKKDAFEQYDFGFRSENGSGYKGYGFWVEEEGSEQNVTFNRLRENLREATTHNQESRAARGIPQLLVDMREDPQSFYDKLCKWTEDPGCTSELPFLHHASTDEFMSAYFSAQPQNLRKIYYAIKDRIEKASRRPDWEAESKWWDDLLQKLHREVSVKKPLERLRYQRSLPIPGAPKNAV